MTTDKTDPHASIRADLARLLADYDTVRAATLAEVRERLTSEEAWDIVMNQCGTDMLVALADHVCGPAGATTGEARPADEPAPPVADATDARDVIERIRRIVDFRAHQQPCSGFLDVIDALDSTKIGTRAEPLQATPAPSDSAVESVAAPAAERVSVDRASLLARFGALMDGAVSRPTEWDDDIADALETIAREVAETTLAEVLSLDGLGEVTETARLTHGTKPGGGTKRIVKRTMRKAGAR